MLTPLQQRRLWEEWFYAEVRAYYFADLAGRFDRRQRLVTWLSLFGASGALVAALGTILAGRWPWLPGLVALLPSGLGFYALVADNPHRAAECRSLYEGWSTLAADRSQLWDDMYGEDAPARLAAMEARGRSLSSRGTTLRIREEDEQAKLLYWYAKVEAEHAARQSHAA
jgi:hypothetical protein